MSSRLSCLVVGGLFLSVSIAHAQTSSEPSITPAFPMPPLTVPITPTPLDEPTQSVLDANKIRTYWLETKHIKPSLLAHYLDPKNHPLPAFAQEAHPTILNNFVLPEGIDRIVALDPQNRLLVFGTERAVAALQATIALLDPLQINTAPSVTLEASLYWVDSLAPSAETWQKTAAVPRAALLSELLALPKLKAQDRAIVQLFPVKQTVASQLVAIPFESTSVAELPKAEPTPPQSNNWRNFQSQMPRIKPEADIDPGIRPYQFKPEPLPTIRSNVDQLVMFPMSIEKDIVKLLVSGLHSPARVLVLRDGETFLLSGSAKEKKLKSPSPRFDTFVVAIKVHVTQPAPVLPTP